MQPNIPVPTDNIYKFLALFGIIMFISGLWGLAYFAEKYNELGYENYLELELINIKIKKDATPEDITRRTVLEWYAKAIRRYWTIFEYSFTACAAFGFFLSVFGYYSWFRNVQPNQDELLNLQIEKMRREIQVLDKQLQEKETE